MNTTIAVIKSIIPTTDDMKKINAHTCRTFQPNEVFTFSVILCDNEIDRDHERFPVETLSQLTDLFVGKTGIFDHNPKGEFQTARIYETALCVEHDKLTTIGEPYTYIKAKAYMVKSEKNADLILEIQGGIKKEVSISCSVNKTICSTCGKNLGYENCSHQKGKLYGGKPCHHLLKEATDAYEWSFVAVPAQRNAGVTKQFHTQKEGEKNMRDINALRKLFDTEESSIQLSKNEISSMKMYLKSLEQSAQMGEAYRQDLIKEVSRLSFLSHDEISSEVLKSVLNKMNIDELKAFQAAYEKRTQESFSVPQLAFTATEKSQNNHSFKL